MIRLSSLKPILCLQNAMSDESERVAPGDAGEKAAYQR